MSQELLNLIDYLTTCRVDSKVYINFLTANVALLEKWKEKLSLHLLGQTIHENQNILVLEPLDK